MPGKIECNCTCPYGTVLKCEKELTIKGKVRQQCSHDVEWWWSVRNQWVCLSKGCSSRNLQMAYKFFILWCLSSQGLFSQTWEAWRRFPHEQSSNKSLSFNYFSWRALHLTKLNWSLSLWYMTQTFPMSSLLKLWFQITLSITCPICMLVHLATLQIN